MVGMLDRCYWCWMGVKDGEMVIGGCRGIHGCPGIFDRLETKGRGGMVMLDCEAAVVVRGSLKVRYPLNRSA